MTNPAWTYSQLDAFETCPKKFYHLRVARDVVEPPNESSAWGERVHTAMELRVRDGVALPEGMEQWEGIAAKLAALPGEKLCEQKMALDKNFQPADWKQAWSRGIADLLVVHKDKALVIDHKTGKRKPSEQLMLYALYAFAYYENVEEVGACFVWLKEKKMDKQVFTRRDIPDMWKEFLPRVSKLENSYENNKWPSRPSGLCKGWCPVKSCEFNGKR